MSLREAATRAAVWGVIADAAKDRQNEAKAELAELEPGDTIAGKVGGQIIAKATMTKGRERISTVDPAALLEWVRTNHPTELVQSVESVNPAYLKTFKAVGGVVIDGDGEPVPGVKVEYSDPYVTVRKEKDATALVAELLSSGAIALDGIKAVEA